MPPRSGNEASFCKNLAHDSRGRCAQRHANRNLVSAGGGARKRQRGDIRACDQQHQSHGRKQEAQSGLDVSHELGAKGERD